MSDRHDRWNPRLSELLDGVLPPEDAREARAHLQVCEACRLELEGLRALKARAAVLGPVRPGRDLWPDIETRLEDRREGVIALPVGRPDRADQPANGLRQGGAGAPAPHEGGDSTPSAASRTRGGLRLSVAQWGSAAAVLVLGSSLLTWWVRPAASGPTAMEDPPSAVTQASQATLDQTDPAGGDGRSERLQELTSLLEDARGKLEPRTLRILERNLAVIDRAIAESRRALAEDPSNPFLQEHLDRARGRKLSYLEEAAGIVSRARS